MGQIFLTADLHLGHNKPFIYEARGFKTIEEHDAAIIENINSTVAEYDTLYILGDLMLGDNHKGIELLSQIRCKKVGYIAGNHDTGNRMFSYETWLDFEFMGYARQMKVGKRSFMLSHYPMLTSNFDDDHKLWERTYNLCGHTHQRGVIAPGTNYISVGLDAWGNQPVSLDAILDVIRIRCENLTK